MFDSVDAVAEAFRGQAYVAGRDVATQVYLATGLKKPLLVHGPGGSGRSALARALANTLGTELFEVHCHTAIEAAETTHSWDTGRQLLHLREAEAAGKSLERARSEAFSVPFLLPGPILRAFQSPSRAVLLVREIDRASEAFQQWLADALTAFRVEMPGFGPVTAASPPVVVLTASDPNAVFDALGHRCLAISLSYPQFEVEVEILLRHVAGLSRPLAAQVSNFLGRLRKQPLVLRPGLDESLDWARALVTLHVATLTPELVEQTVGCILKDPRDIAEFNNHKFVAMLGGRVNLTG
ncbi:MAG: AAA family ATPase [bacterium]